MLSIIYVYILTFMKAKKCLVFTKLFIEKQPQTAILVRHAATRQNQHDSGKRKKEFKRYFEFTWSKMTTSRERDNYPDIKQNQSIQFQSF